MPSIPRTDPRLLRLERAALSAVPTVSVMLPGPECPESLMLSEAEWVGTVTPEEARCVEVEDLH